jgi:hypothetical protein
LRLRRKVVRRGWCNSCCTESALVQKRAPASEGCGKRRRLAGTARRNKGCVGDDHGSTDLGRA